MKDNVLQTLTPNFPKCDFPKICAISIPAFQCQTRQINSCVGQNIGARKALPRLHEFAREKCGLFNLQVDMHGYFSYY